MEQHLARLENGGAAADVAQTVFLLYRRLAVGRFRKVRRVADKQRSAGCQPATQQTASLRYKRFASARASAVSRLLICCIADSLSAKRDHALRILDARQNIRHDFRLRLRALRAAVVETHAHRAGFQVATADDQP
jgi:hypothetical protein